MLGPAFCIPSASVTETATASHAEDAEYAEVRPTTRRTAHAEQSKDNEAPFSAENLQIRPVSSASSQFLLSVTPLREIGRCRRRCLHPGRVVENAASW